jgi:hypothetical protein
MTTGEQKMTLTSGDMFARLDRKNPFAKKEPTNDHLTPVEYSCPDCGTVQSVRNLVEFEHGTECPQLEASKDPKDWDLERNWIAIDVKVYGK